MHGIFFSHFPCFPGFPGAQQWREHYSILPGITFNQFLLCFLVKHGDWTLIQILNRNTGEAQARQLLKKPTLPEQTVSNH